MATYSDLSLDPLNSSPTLEDLASIKQAISSYLSTRVGERFFRPELGSTLPTFKFKTMDTNTEFDILSSISEDIESVDPRVEALHAYDITRPDYSNHHWKVSATLQTKLGSNKIGFNTPIGLGR